MRTSTPRNVSYNTKMLWNWDTLDTCFLSSSWHITSHGMFAGFCVAIVALVCLFEFLRCISKRYDGYLLREHQSHRHASASVNGSSTSSGKGNVKNGVNLVTKSLLGNSSKSTAFRPNALQQTVRALLHTLQFALAYIVMLLAMYCNGYVIICIYMGTFIGFFLFRWESMMLEGQREDAVMCCG